jgi:hypothetical protein
LIRWVGIDEAGYGPNLGPLVLTSVAAEGLTSTDTGATTSHPPDLWRSLSATVDRAGGDPNRLWIDDSKLIYRAGAGRERLEAACLSLLEAVGTTRPTTAASLLAALHAGSLETCELHRWLAGEFDWSWPRPGTGSKPRKPKISATSTKSLNLNESPLRNPAGAWRLVGSRSVVVGPERFSQRLVPPATKATVHFEAFAELLRFEWDRCQDGIPTLVRSDKHGGRNFYLEPLSRALPDAWIERGEEGPVSAATRFEALAVGWRSRSCRGPIATMGLLRWRRSSAKLCESCGWTFSMPSGRA